MRLSDAEVAIVGLGLMGGSLGLALAGKCARRTGVARRPETAALAVEMGAVDRATLDPAEGVANAGIVVLATPVSTIVDMVRQIGPLMLPGALLTDLGSAKRAVVASMDALPDGTVAVGGHPMCGKEKGGLEHAGPDLFSGATFVLTPTTRTTDDGLRLALDMVEAIGACPLVMDAARHDGLVAYTSHLPYLLAAALVRAEAEVESADPLAGRLAASGFRDTTRLAAGDVPWMRDTLLANRDAVERALDSFERQLAEARRLLGDPEGLQTWMTSVRGKRKGMFV